MRRLILLRHAKAEASHRKGDFARGLTSRGRRDARAVGRLLELAGENPDLALVSAAKRASETWEEAGAVLGKARTELLQGLYNASPPEIWDLALDFEDKAEVIVVVGHNPGMQELAVRLARDGSAARSDLIRLTEGFPTAAAAVFALDETRRCSLEQILDPRDGAT